MSEPPGGVPNPYEAPRAVAEAGVDPDGGVMSQEELVAFAGDEAGSYYWERWIRSGRSTGVWASWNWPGAVFGPMWLAYRKLWREFLVALGALVAWDVVEFGLMVAFGLDLPFGEGVKRLMIALAFGLFGNAVFLRRARLEVANVRRLMPEHPSGRVPYLASLGGTSGWAVVGALLVTLAIGLVEGWIIRMLVNTFVAGPT